MATTDIEIRHLAALRAVAREGSFGRAAARLGYTQSAVSQQIAALERALGAAVFDRPGGPRPVELTAVGRLVLDHAGSILDRLHVLDDDLARLQAGEAGRLVVGTFQSVSGKILPEVLGRLRRERPGVEIRLVESDDNDVLADKTASGELDLAFLVRQGVDRRLDVVDLLDDPFVVLAAAESAPTPPTVAVADLADARMIGQGGSVCQVILEQNLRDLGVEPTYVFRSNDNGAVQAMVRAGVGLAVLPFLAVDAADPAIRVLHLDPALPPRTIAVATRAARTPAPAVARFLALSREVCAELAPPPANGTLGIR